MKYTLGVETSCDDTSAALVREDGFVSHLLTTDQHFVHQPYGGIVPELASRNHASLLLPLIEQLFKESDLNWKNVSSMAVTNRPGLVGSLVVGLVTVKTLSLILKKPYVAVNHIEGHILSAFLWDKINKKPSELQFPFLALIVSGGHSHLFEVKNFGFYRIIGQTLDDAAGEVLDKFARMVKLDYPGGASVDKMAQSGQRDHYTFPKVSLKQKGLNFSFSGLKTAAVHLIKKTNPTTNKNTLANLCADFQEAIVDQIMNKLDQTVHQFNFKKVVIAGGVSANSRLRERALLWAKEKNIKLFLPPLQYCTDNAAMIAYTGSKHISHGLFSDSSTNCSPSSLPEDFMKFRRTCRGGERS